MFLPSSDTRLLGQIKFYKKFLAVPHHLAVKRGLKVSVFQNLRSHCIKQKCQAFSTIQY